MIPMKFASAEITDLDRFITDDEVCIEQKLDGTRCLVHITPQGVKFLGHGGRPLTHSAAAQHFLTIADSLKKVVGNEPGEVILDGEIMFDTGIYWLFDVPLIRFGGVRLVEPGHPYWQRRKHLEGPVAGELGPAVRVNSSHFTRHDKAMIVEAVEASNGEGFMVKRLDSPYEPGERVKHSLKVKYVRTADVVVTGSTRGRNEAGRETGSFTFGAYADYDAARAFDLTPLGACSAIGKPHVEIGDVIEVAYLSWVPGGALVQPRMMRVREDKPSVDCLMDQFVPYSKAVV